MTKPPSTGTTPSRTPVRSNYAAPHTPIASAKRPRSSIDKNMLSPRGAGGNNTIGSPLVSRPNLPSTPLNEGLGASVEEELDTIPETPKMGIRNTLDRSQLSPMHPARPLVIHEESHDGEDGVEGGKSESGSWVGRQVDALFSPMLNLLSPGKGDDEGEDEEDRAIVGSGEDDDDAVKPSASPDSTSHATSQETVSHEDGDEEDPHEVTEEDTEQVSHGSHIQRGESPIEDDGSSQGSEAEEEDEFNPYAFIKSLPHYDLVVHLRPPITLPPKDDNSPPISLVLDLDETLVHCTVEPVDDANLVFPVAFHGTTYQVHVRLRPKLYEFLEAIAGKYEVIVFTASQKVYANELLNLIDPDGKYFHHRLFRESCLSVEGNFLKDLNVLGRDLSKTVLVDNSPHAFGYQVDNGIPIESWFDDPEDRELLKLERFLRTLHGASDARSVVRKTFQTYRLVADS